MFLTLATSSQIHWKILQHNTIFDPKNSVLPQCAQPRNRKHCKKLTTRAVLPTSKLGRQPSKSKKCNKKLESFSFSRNIKFLLTHAKDAVFWGSIHSSLKVPNLSGCLHAHNTCRWRQVRLSLYHPKRWTNGSVTHKTHREHLPFHISQVRGNIPIFYCLQN